MGMYTRLDLNVALKPDDKEFIDTVTRMVNGNAPELPGRMAWMFGSSSYYHDNIQHASIEFDEIGNNHKLSVVCDLKNYENEIEKFLEMLAPHVETSKFAGYVRYEENELPDLIWFVGGKVVRVTPSVPQEVISVLEES